MMMQTENITYRQVNSQPIWMKSERYDYCEHKGPTSFSRSLKELVNRLARKA